MSEQVLVIDNYDSFTYNLVQLLGQLGADVVVRRNDEVSAEQVRRDPPRALILSPGPGRPEDAGICGELIRVLAPTVPTLGVCLGHQCIAQAFGATVSRADRVMHGKVSSVFHDGEGVFRGLANPLSATRYHSLVVQPKTLPPELRVVAWTEDGTVMGLQHARFPLTGVQFHPESILTDAGPQLLTNFLNSAR